MGEILGRNLLTLRKNKNLSPAEVAASLGMTPEELQCYEFGIKIPSEEALAKICKYYGVDSAELHIAGNFDKPQTVTKVTPQEQPKIVAKPVTAQPIPAQPQQVQTKVVPNDNVVKSQPVQPAKETQGPTLVVKGSDSTGIVAGQPMEQVDKKAQKKAEKEAKLQALKESQARYAEEQRQKKLAKHNATVDTTSEIIADSDQGGQVVAKRFPKKLHICLLILSIAVAVGLFLPYYKSGDIGISLFDLVMGKVEAKILFISITEIIKVPIFYEIAFYGAIALTCILVWNIVMCILTMIPCIRRSGLVVVHKIVMIISSVGIFLLTIAYLMSYIFFIINSGNIASYKNIGVGAYITISGMFLSFFFLVCTFARTKTDKIIKGEK